MCVSVYVHPHIPYKLTLTEYDIDLVNDHYTEKLHFRNFKFGSKYKFSGIL